MVSFWKNKSADEGQAAEGEEEQQASQPRATTVRAEREPLLGEHRPATHLTADDPAVEISPYNLFVVRSLRRVSIFLLMISLAWWVICLVSTFIAIPGLITRGSSFTQLSYASISIANLLISLIFFVTPSQGERVASFTLSFLLFVDAIIIVAVTRLRYEESWVGIATVLWAAAIGAWTVMSDRVVEAAKKSEEERLVGRAETRRTLTEWLSVFSSFILFLVLIVAIVLMTLTLIMRAVDSGLEAPGDRFLVESDNYAIHIYCVGDSGKSDVTVLVEAGETSAEVFSTWVTEAQREGLVGRVCITDRPGFGWSDNAPSPLSAGRATDALSEALIEAEEKGPWVLVSHGVGGIYSRIFASRHTAAVQGILLVDTMHEDLFDRVANARNGFFLWVRGFVSPLGITQVFGWVFGGRSIEDRVVGRAAWRSGRWIKAKFQESLAGMATANEVSAARAILPRDVPLSVVSSGKVSRRDAAWRNAQKDLTTITDRLLSFDEVKYASHNVWEDNEGRAILKKRLAEVYRTGR